MANQMFQELSQTQAPLDMLWIPGGTFLMGSDDFYPEEGPSTKSLSMASGWIGTSSSTNSSRASSMRPATSRLLNAH